MVKKVSMKLRFGVKINRNAEDEMTNKTDKQKHNKRSAMYQAKQKRVCQEWRIKSRKYYIQTSIRRKKMMARESAQ